MGKKIMYSSENNNGYKTLGFDSIGQNVRVEYPLIKDKRLKPSRKMVYAFIRLYMNNNTKKSCISMHKLREKSGYSFDTLLSSIKDLELNGYIKVKKEKVDRDKRHYHHAYYFLINDEKFAQITYFFLESEILSIKEKEFILLIFPYILPNDRIGSVTNIVGYEELMGFTGLSRNTIKERIKTLSEKNLVFDAYSRRSGNEPLVCVGWEFDMKTIMLDATLQIARERNEYYYRLKDYGLDVNID